MEKRKKKKVIKILCEGRHCGGMGEGLPEHTCPYAEDVNSDSETLCTCCDMCQHECAMDI